MKTAREWAKHHFTEGGAEEMHEFVDRIQRDAREGMVPAVDVQPLAKAFDELLEELHGHEVVGQRADGDIYWYNTGDTLINLTSLRAKHPNLFTK